MKRITLAATFIAVALATAGVATAQSTVKLNMEETHIIKESVLKNSKFTHVKPGTFEAGDAAPTDVTLQEFPGEVTGRVSAVKGHVFFIAGDEVVIVSNSDKKVANVIK